MVICIQGQSNVLWPSKRYFQPSPPLKTLISSLSKETEQIVKAAVILESCSSVFNAYRALTPNKQSGLVHLLIERSSYVVNLSST